MPRFFFRLPWWRAILETLLLGGALWCILFVFHQQAPITSQEAAARPEVLSLMLGPVCMLWCAIRLRMPDGPWWRRRLLEACVYGCVGGVLAGIVVWIGNTPFVLHTRHSYVVATFAVLAFFLNCTVFILSRIGLRLLLFWDQLRRKQLLWSLTHAHLMVVALAAGLLIILMDLSLLFSNRVQALIILPATIVLALLSAVAMLVILPPSLLFSYLVVRNTTYRLKALAAATSALRRGNYAVRVAVQGEDEVAQLQTDFNAMAADLQQAMRDLQEERDTVARLLQARRELVATVSHELRTPMAILRSYLETTLMHWEDSEQETIHHNIHVMEDEVIHLQGLVEDLFSLSRADVGRLALQCHPIDVGSIVMRVVDANAPLVWQKSRIELVADVPSVLPKVLVDPQRLEQVLQNLLHNGIRHTSPGGILAVACSMEAEKLGVHVSDTGEGIDSEDLSHIWERFYQTASTRARQDGGAGLGLALVKEWIEAMGGEVAVHSVLGEGSRFSLFLPLAPDI